jgi:hypothetical protein
MSDFGRSRRFFERWAAPDDISAAATRRALVCGHTSIPPHGYRT